MNFKQFLKEAEMAFMSKKFIKTLEKYVDINDKKALKELVKYKKDIPQMFKTPGTLYRGMTLTEKEIDDISKKGFTLKDASSWTEDVKIAKKFASQHGGKIKKGKVGIIFKRKFNKEIVIRVQGVVLYLSGTGLFDKYDFDEIAADSALKEQEIIVDGNLKLTEKDIFKIIK